MWKRILKAFEKIDIGEKTLNYFTSAQFIVSVIILLAVLLILIILKRTFRIIKKKTREANKDKGILPGNKTLPGLFENIISSVVLLIAVLAILQVNGINVSSLMASLGIASVIVGLALQDILKDLIMGFHILSDRFFDVGDVVRYHGIEGIVISFNTKTTKIQSIDDFSVTSISNRNIDEITKVGDFAKINIPLAYDEDTKKVHRVLGEITERIKEIEEIKTAVYKGAMEFQDSAIIYRINYFIEPKDKWTVWYKVMKLVQDGLEAEDIHIPFNQLDVHEIPAKK